MESPEQDPEYSGGCHCGVMGLALSVMWWVAVGKSGDDEGDVGLYLHPVSPLMLGMGMGVNIIWACGIIAQAWIKCVSWTAGKPMPRACKRFWGFTA